MASVCLSNCANDARDPQVPVRATYVNLYKWPESDAEFVRSVSANSWRGQPHCRPRFVDSISCRQMYLRSYTFTREEETTNETTPNCFGKAAKDKVADHRKKRKKRREVRGIRRKRKCLVLRGAFFRFFKRMLSCSASVDVIDPIA